VARTQIRKALEKLGVAYIQTTTGKEAWDYLTELAEEAVNQGLPQVNRIQLILSDIEMPDMDGFTLTKHIRSDPRLAHLPVVLHSSLTGSCNQEKGAQVGATDYVTKFDPKEFSSKLMRYIL
ncbi:MAG: response regulator, partial [Pseudohongiella sp.]|nr:response regulator [Pseudohongiella sp.]